MPSSTSYSVASVSTAANVVRTATFNGSLAAAYDTSYKATAKLTKGGEEEFPISSASLPTRSDKFFGTTSTFAKGGALVGATIANAITLPYDFLAGQGREQDGFENLSNGSGEDGQGTSSAKGVVVLTPSVAPTASTRSSSGGSILNKGLLGHGVDAVTTGTGFATEVAGAFTGASIAVAGSPASPMSSKGFGAWVRSGAQQGGTTSATVATTVIGGTLGLALDVIRAPSVAAKYGTALIFAIPGAAIGTVGGGIRSLINR